MAAQESRRKQIQKAYRQALRNRLPIMMLVAWTCVAYNLGKFSAGIQMPWEIIVYCLLAVSGYVTFTLVRDQIQFAEDGKDGYRKFMKFRLYHLELTLEKVIAYQQTDGELHKYTVVALRELLEILPRKVRSLRLASLEVSHLSGIEEWTIPMVESYITSLRDELDEL